MALQIRRGTEAERTAGGGVVFAEGELIYVTDTDALYVGDGSTAGGVKLTDNAGATLGTYITADTINSTIDLQQDLDLNGNDIIGTGNINIDGTVTATGNINIGDDADSDTVDFTAKITSSLTPSADSTHNIGAMNARWNNGYFTGLWVDGQVNAVAVNGNVIANDSTVMVDASANTFTGNLTGDVTGDTTGTHTGAVVGDVTGNVTGNTTGYHTGDVKGSLFGDDSTPIIDAVNNTLAGNLTGNVTGNVTGDVVGNVKGSISNDPIIDSLQGPADAIINAFNITATGTITGNLTGDVTGNVTGNVTGSVVGDLKGSVFADDSSVLVDAVAGTIPGENITGTITANLTGSVTGDVKGSIFGDDSTTIVDSVGNTLNANTVTTTSLFASTIDSSDSSAIQVTPAMTFNSDVYVEQAVHVTSDGISDVITLDNTGVINCQSLETLVIKHTSAGEIRFEDRAGFIERVAFEKLLVAQDDVQLLTIAGEFSSTLAVETFTGDPEDDASVADPANYDKHFEATTEKVSFGVPAKFAVVADDSARSTLVPSPEKGMVILMEAGTTPAATNQLQFFDGSNWVNV